MVKLRVLLVAAAHCVAFSGTAHGQHCDSITGSYIAPCSGGCNVTVKGCRYGTGDCYEVIPGVHCPCGDLNEYVGTAENIPDACSQLVRPTVKVPVRTVSGVARTFLIYLPNCKGSFSIQEVVS